MDFEATRTRLLAHYVTLAKEPGWKAYVWDRVQQMAAEEPDLWGDMPKLLTQAMRGTNDPHLPANQNRELVEHA